MDSSARERCQACTVRDRALCSVLDDGELGALSRVARRKRVAKGAVVAWEGDENPLCANVITGTLKLVKATADGREQAVGLLFEGDFLGQPFTGSNDLTAVALTDTDLCLFPRPEFERALADNPKLERALLERTMLSLNQARERQLMLARKSARARIAGFLTDLTIAADGTATLPMSRGDMADYLGLTIETVSRQLTELKRMRLIDGDRGGREIRLLDRSSLQSIADD